MALVRKTAQTKFDSSIEAHVRLGVDPRHADQMVRSSVVLPHGTGKTRRIAVFALGEKAREALEAGAGPIGGGGLGEKVQGGGSDLGGGLRTTRVIGLVGAPGQ